MKLVLKTKHGLLKQLVGTYKTSGDGFISGGHRSPFSNSSNELVNGIKKCSGISKVGPDWMIGGDVLGDVTVEGLERDLKRSGGTGIVEVSDFLTGEAAVEVGEDLEDVVCHGVVGLTESSGYVASHKGDIKNVVDPRLQGDFDVNSAWRAVEVAMACVSQTSAKRPTMNQVVIDLNESLAIEIGRETEHSIKSMSLNLNYKLPPLARVKDLCPHQQISYKCETEYRASGICYIC
ncbi:hypothetical protein EZV62_003658 [Acer yangbiense]|uniref:Serine-threonine/tyrosine-protein kinase catalytic domain-containing protein n=1 Tax=Acer yangbiense TaxID=1000413 RepID=A0A5C7IHF6_9ROSI|nr:hypothetical protein EZV62_003658 [Acer yangbiense]